MSKNINRLEYKCPELYDALNKASVTLLRKTALDACKAAVEINELYDPDVLRAIHLLEVKSYGDATLTQSLEALAETLEGGYGEVTNAEPYSDVDEYEVSADFSRARSADAVRFALGVDAHEATIEAIYEALAADDDTGSVRKILYIDLNV